MIISRATIGLFAKFLNISTVLLVIPFIGLNLGEEAVGLWLLFYSIGGITGLFEAGFYNSVLRFVSYISAGKKDLLSEGIGQIIEQQDNEIKLAGNVKLNTLIITVSILYICLGVTAFSFLSIFGTIYLDFLELNTIDISIVRGSWLLFILASCIHLTFSFLSATLHGIGKINQNNFCLIISKSAFLLVAIYGLYKGEGIVFLSFIFLLHVCLMRVLNFVFLIPNLSLSVKDFFRIKSFSWDIFKSLQKNSLKMGAVNIGSYLLSRGSIIVANGAIAVEAVTKYTFTITSFTVLAMIATEPLNLMYDRICHYQSRNDREQIKRMIKILYFAGLLIFLSGTLFIFIFEYYSKVFGLNFNFMTQSFLILASLIYLFEYTSSFSAIYLTSKNYIPFMNAALISGVAVTLLNVIFVNQYQLLGLILIYFFVQSCYNFWKWPLELKKDLS